MDYFTPSIEQLAEVGVVGAIIAAIAAFLVLMIFVIIALYVYWGFAWMTIAKKLKYDKPWLAWIPVANLFLIPILAKKNWAWGFFILLPPVYGGLMIWWLWIIYQRRNYPGPLALINIGSLIPLGPISGAATIANLVVIGLVAWKDMPTKKKK